MSQEYSFLLYDTRLKERARDLRKNQTAPENHIWQKILRNKQFFGYKFTRQKMLNGFIVDFYCSELLCVIEIDGESHFTPEWKDYDTERTCILEGLWLQIIRFTNTEVMENIEWVYEILIQKLWIEP